MGPYKVFLYLFRRNVLSRHVCFANAALKDLVKFWKDRGQHPACRKRAGWRSRINQKVSRQPESLYLWQTMLGFESKRVQGEFAETGEKMEMNEE